MTVKQLAGIVGAVLTIGGVAIAANKIKETAEEAQARGIRVEKATEILQRYHIDKKRFLAFCRQEKIDRSKCLDRYEEINEKITEE